MMSGMTMIATCDWCLQEAAQVLIMEDSLWRFWRIISNENPVLSSLRNICKKCTSNYERFFSYINTCKSNDFKIQVINSGKIKDEPSIDIEYHPVIKEEDLKEEILVSHDTTTSSGEEKKTGSVLTVEHERKPNKPFKCLQCNRFFTQSDMHQEIRHGPDISTSTPEICESDFQNFVTFNENITEVEKINENMNKSIRRMDINQKIGHGPDISTSTTEICESGCQNFETWNENITYIEKIKENVNKSIRRRRKHCCIFCNKKIGNFARHIERHHGDELQVQEIMVLDKLSIKRRKLIDRLRKEGDFCTSKVNPVHADPKRDSSDYIACKFCRGYYARKTLRRHVKKCYFNPVPSKRINSQIEGQAIMVGRFGPHDPLVTTGLLRMLRADNISLIAKKDDIICEVARRYLKSHKNKYLLVIAKRYMRRLARILEASRRILLNERLRLRDILQPSRFKILVEATKSIADYDLVNGTFGSPSLALQMGTLIKHAINAALSTEIQEPRSSKVFIANLKLLLGLIDSDWAHEVSTQAGQNLSINRFNRPCMIPAAQDIKRYRLPDNVYQTAKVSKILMLSQQTGLEKFKGMSIDDIAIDDYLVEEEIEDTHNTAEEAEFHNTEGDTTANEEQIQQPTTSVSLDVVTKKGKKRTLVSWTEQQKALTQKYFAKHIKNKKPPKKHEVLDLVKKNPSIFDNKSWPVIKVFVCNKFKK